MKPRSAGNPSVGEAPIDRPRRPWFAWLVVGSLVLHAVLLVVLQPWARTVMRFDREAEAERTQLVQQREEARREMERKRRQELPLPRDLAAELVEREKLKHHDALKQNVVRLVEAREKAFEARREAFERLERREERDVLPDQIERLNEALRKMESAAHEVSRESKYHESSQPIKAELSRELEDFERLRRQAEKSAEQADEPLLDYREQADRLAKRASQLAEQYEQWKQESSGSANHRAGEAASAARHLADRAGALANGVDMGELNDTESAEPIADVPAAAATSEATAQAEPDALYEAAVHLELQSDLADKQARAAELAVVQGSSFAEAQAKTASPAPVRPDLAPALAAADNPDSTGTDAMTTVGDLNAYRQAIAQARTETSDMASRAERRQSAESATAVRGVAAQSEQDRQRAAEMDRLSRTRGDGVVVDMTTLQLSNYRGAGGNQADMAGIGLRADQTGLGGDMAAGQQNRTVRLGKRNVTANALPGRMLTDDSARSGFLYLDTWYFIGPWDNWSRADFEIVHPPEQRVDLDATYHDGKFANRPSHPDHVLRWEFLQSDRIAIEPPRITYSATWYAYTEVYSDRARQMLVAVASDDMAKVWLNGDVIWTDVGQSSWNLDEGFRRVIFHRGFNTVLVRIENGPAYCAFSVLLCPPELVEPTQAAQ